MPIDIPLIMQTFLQIAMKAAIEAGEEIMRIYNDPLQDFGIERKADNSPLTIADKAAHSCIVSHLSQTSIPILSEEGVHLPYAERRTWHRLWVVDPLDGTKEFIKKNGEFTVNIALVEDGVPVLGVIYVPAKDVLYWGIVGEGAWKEDGTGRQRMPLAQQREVFVVVASRSHLSPETEVYINAMKRRHALVEIVNSGSSLKICLVAEGAADVYPRFAPTMEWDTAAGDAIARAAGAKVLNAETQFPLLYNKPDLHNPWFVVSRE